MYSDHLTNCDDDLTHLGSQWKLCIYFRNALNICINFTFIVCRCQLWSVSHTICNDWIIFILTLIIVLCSVEVTLQNMSATPAQHHHDILHCNNHSSTENSISSERQVFQIFSLHHVKKESSQITSHSKDTVKVINKIISLHQLKCVKLIIMNQY